MKFIKYGSITNSYRQEFIDKILFEEMDGGEWNVTEKIHGANFSLWVDKDTVRMAKRSCFIPDDSGFYGIQALKDELKDNARKLYNYLVHGQSDKINSEIAIYGELYGGSYPHPHVAANPKAKKVQGKVWYSQDNQFSVYDILIDGLFLPFKAVKAYCDLFDFYVMDELFHGSFKECLEHGNEFPSMVYKKHNLPEIEDNICEGIVIRPDDARFVFSGSRVMLKSKNARFAEKEPKKEKIKVELSPELRLIIEELDSMATENRYDSVVSKIGDVSPKDFGMILGLMVKDILEEMEGDTKLFNAYNKLEKVERKTINKTLGYSVSKIVRKKLIGIPG